MNASKVDSGESDLVNVLTVPEIATTTSEESFAIVPDGSIQETYAAFAPLSSLDSSFAIVQDESGPCSSSFVEIVSEKCPEMSRTDTEASFVVVKDNSPTGDHKEAFDDMKTKASSFSDDLCFLSTTNEEFAPLAIDGETTTIDPSVKPLARDPSGSPASAVMPSVNVPKVASISPAIHAHTAEHSSECGCDARTLQTVSAEIDSDSFVVVEATVQGNDSSISRQPGAATEDLRTKSSLPSEDLHSENTANEEHFPIDDVLTSIDLSVKLSASEGVGKPTTMDETHRSDSMSSTDLPNAADGSPTTHGHAADEECGSGITDASSKPHAPLQAYDGASIGADALLTTDKGPLVRAGISPNEAEHGHVSREIENEQIDYPSHVGGARVLATGAVLRDLPSNVNADIPSKIGNAVSATDPSALQVPSDDNNASVNIATNISDEQSKVSMTDGDIHKTTSENITCMSKDEGILSSTGPTEATTVPKPNVDAITGATPMSERDTCNTDSGVPNVKEGSEGNGSIASGTICQPTEKAPSTPATTVDEHLGLAAGTDLEAKGSSAASKTAVLTSETDTISSAMDKAFPSKDDAPSLSKDFPAKAEIDGPPVPKTTDDAATPACKSGDGILKAENVNSIIEISSTTATDAMATDPKPSSDLNNTLTSTIPKSEKDMCNTGMPNVKENSKDNNVATGINCQGTEKAPPSTSATTVDSKLKTEMTITSEADTISSATDKAFPNKDDVPSVSEGLPSKVEMDGAPVRKNTDDAATHKTDDGIPKAENVDSKREEISSTTATAGKASNASGTNCQPTDKAPSTPVTTVDEHLGLAAATDLEAKGSSAASKNPADPDNRLYHCRGKSTCDSNPDAGASPFPLASPQSDGCVKVIFHVIVPQDLWGWDEHSCVHLCFGHEKLGSWKTCHGDFTRHDPSSTDPMCEMTCTLSMDTEVLKEPQPYKYVVFSPKVMKHKATHSFEFLYGHSKSHGHNNRCLAIPDPELIIGGRYVQYDTIAYPCKKVVDSKAPKGGSAGSTGGKKTWFSSATDVVKSTVGKVLHFVPWSTEVSFAMSHNEERIYSMCVYLKQCVDDLHRVTYTKNLVQMAEEMEHIYDLMSSVQIINNKGIKKQPANISQEIVEFCSKTLENLKDFPAETQLCASISVIYFSCGLLKKDFSPKFVAVGLSLLRLSPHQESKSCSGITILHSLIPEEKRGAVGNAILRLCSQQLRNTKEPLRTEWLHALPLAHLLCGCCTPFGEMPRPKDLIWVEKTLRNDVLGRNEILNGFEQYQILQDLFQLDPLLLPIFVHVCPKKELTALFEFIPPYVSTAYISYLISVEEWSSSRVNEYLLLLSVVSKAVTKAKVKTSIFDQTIQESCSMLIDEVNRKIQATKKGHSVELLKAIIPLLLSAYSTCSGHQSEKSENLNLYTRLVILMEAWITSKDLIGHPSFGGNEDSFTTSWKGMDELKLWQEILNIEKNCAVTGKMLEMWHTVVCEQIKKRIYQLKDKTQLKLVCCVEELSDMHSLLVNAVFDIGAEAIDKIFVQGGKQALDHIEELAKKDSIRIGNLIGRILVKKYPLAPSDTFEVIFDELIEWDFWPCFLKISCGTSKVKDGLNKHCVAVCGAAVKRLTHLCTQLSSGEIIVKELQRVKEREQHLLMLCDAARMFSVSVQGDLKQRMRELDCYKSHSSLLCHLHAKLPQQMQGWNQLHAELGKDIGSLSIRTLCSSSSAGIVNVTIQAAGPLNDIARLFHIMTSEHPSSTFNGLWESHLHSEIGKHTSAGLTFNHICDYVWKPSLSLCCNYVTSCQNQTIHLETIDILFKSDHYQGTLENELLNLSQGVSLCARNCEDSGGWVQSTCKCIRNYWKLCTCKEPATCLLRIKRAIDLTGDFQNVEMLEKGIENVMKTEALNKITDTLVDTGDFLTEIATNNQKRHCIEMFQKCVKFRKWLKKVTKGVNDLNRFVTIALSTATGGEDAVTQEKLYNLRAVGSGFAPLIYSLSRDAGFFELSKCCRSMWKVLETNPELPTLLDGCMEHLDWYRHIKQNIGSVEQSSFKQLEHIQLHGQYSVFAAAKRSFSRLQIQDVVQLTILPQDEYAIKRQYSLEELRDLESRLILVTSQEAKNRNGVDQFMHTLHSICCIGEVLVKLLRAGNVSYNSFVLTCSCKIDFIEDLKKLGKQMEKDLQSWNKELMSMRDTYYELNYYTNAQLLAIRKEMANEQFSPSLQSLLQSISPKSTEHHLKIAVGKCLENIGGQCNEILSVQQNLTFSILELPLTTRPGLSIRTTAMDSNFLTLQQVGQILQTMKSTPQALDSFEKQRLLPGTLACGKPNLITTDSSNVLKAVLSIYMEDPSSPLPTLDEVLLCNQHTTEEEALLLFKRATKDPGFKRIYCLVHAEKLSYKVADNILQLLDETTQGHSDYRLVIVCGTDEGVSHITAKLLLFQRPSFKLCDDIACAQYLQSKLVHIPTPANMLFHVRTASVKKRYSAIVVSSSRSGMGKSLYVQRMAESIGGSHIVHVPVHGPDVTADSMLELLENHEDSTCSIFHLDVVPTVLHQANSILFSLLILKGLTDTLGNTWRCYEKDMYVVEVTVLEQEDNSVAASFLSFINLLPRLKCVSPLLLRDTKDTIPEDIVGCDTVIFQQKCYQVVYKYLRGSRGRSTPDVNRLQDQLQLYMQHCGLRNPSWSELDHFVNFLAAQLEACTNSTFCNETYVGDTLQGMKEFVVKFMIRMSRDFATPSLQGELTYENIAQNQGEAGDQSIVKYQINEQKKWDKSSHPYLFFNKDGETITFFGFIVTPEGHLIDPRHQGLQQQSSSQQDIHVLQQSVTPPRRSVIRECHDNLFDPRHQELQHNISLQNPVMQQQHITNSMQGRLGSSFPSGNRLSREAVARRSIGVQRGMKTFTSNTPSVIECSIMSPRLFSGLQLNGVDFNENYSSWIKGDIIKKLAIVMGLSMKVKDPDPSYALTVDNVLKILAMQMRFRCNIPVILMGESGCGKTRLVQYMCNLAAQSTETTNMKVLKVHGGTSEDDIVLCVREAEKLAKDNIERGLDTVVFFDEANTTEAIGLIKEIMCDGRMKGSPISTSIKFIAACNPYRRHSDVMINKLESAGLGFYVKCTETQERLGKTPLRHLVYRVLELPPSMRSLVYDFGQLDNDTEAEYVIQIVKNKLGHQFDLSTIAAIAHVLSWSQQYMKNQKDECSYVSLRDVKRAVIVFEYFNSSPFVNEQEISRSTSSMILSLALCYSARLLNRDDYEHNVCNQFRHPIALTGGVQQFREEVLRCQEILLKSMEVEPNIAHNAALRENVFMMAICIELRIPLFIIGKPGSSKSLAKSIVTSSMLGAGSSKSLLKKFKEVYVESYQCSQHSTPESIKSVFRTAQKVQEKQGHSQFVSVVILDEVGLAEDSPHLPLKALHPLLEDGTQDDPHSCTRVAFIGISNWALDPAKMNRGLMLTRGEPSTQELIDSARGICSGLNDGVLKNLNHLFESLAKAYQAISKEQIEINAIKKEFYGLRDFYSLIKMLYCFCKSHDRMPSWPELSHAILRNFGGREGFDPCKEFCHWIHMHLLHKKCDCVDPPTPDSSLLGMIRSSLLSKDSTLNGESRYLLFLTENYAALQILLHHLKDVIMSHTKSGSGVEPYVLFGSSFPKDKEYTQICQNVNQIKLCMETGRTVILLNLENLYESLYDALNQYYIKCFGKRYVDLGLQAHKVKCMVHEDFKLVLIAEKKTVYEKFPIPLISRLEKHYVVTSSVFNSWQNEVLTQLIGWATKFSVLDDYDSSSRFKVEEVFIGYQKDTPAAAIFQATKQCRQIRDTKHNPSMVPFVPETVSVEKEGSEFWKNAILLQSQHLLLQTATPDAVFRINESVVSNYKVVQSEYFKHIYCPSLTHYLSDRVSHCHERKGHLMQVTTHSRLLSRDEILEITSTLQVQTEVIYLQQFDAEIDFSNQIRSLFQRKPGKENENVLIVIQCQSGHQYGDLIACARYRVNDEKVKNIQSASSGLQQLQSCDLRMSQSNGMTHVLFIIYLPRQTPSLSFVGFQGDPWSSVHIDELRPTDEDIMTINALTLPISELFYTPLQADRQARLRTHDHGGLQVNFHKRLHGCIQAAVARLQSSSQLHDRGTTLVTTLFDLIPEAPPPNLDQVPFYEALVKHIHSLLKQMEEIIPQCKQWALNEARSHKSLRNGGTLRNTLIRKIDDVIIPLLAYILLFIGQYHNLELYRKQDANPVSLLWLSIFSDTSVIQFKYSEISKLNSEYKAAKFECRFPFFWIAKEALEANITVLGSDFPAVLKATLCLPIGKLLNLVNDRSNLFNLYLADFIASTHVRLQKDAEMQNTEFKLISHALDGLVQKTLNETVIGNISMMHKMTALHIAYHANASCLLWISNLMFCIPAVLISLRSKASSPQQLATLVVEETVKHLSPPLEKDQAFINMWLVSVQRCQITVETLLSIYPVHYSSKLRHDWHCIRAVQMFMEHIGSRFEGMQLFAQRLFMKISSCSQIAQDATIIEIKSVLQSIDCSNNRHLERNCHTFFIELISQLCFGHENPSQSVIRLLFDTVFFSTPRVCFRYTRQLSYKEHVDTIPVIRSSLMQLLLKHSFESVKQYLQDYLQISKQILQQQQVDTCLLNLLCIKCFQDVINASHEHKSLRERESIAADLLVRCHKHLICYRGEVTFDYLQAVAQCRTGLLIAGECLYEPSHVQINASLLIAVKSICNDTSINRITPTEAIGPNIFLLKVLARSRNMSTLKQVAKKYTWLLPPALQFSEKEPQPDAFVVYGPVYCMVRDCVADAVYSRNLKELQSTSNDLQGHERIFIILALYEVVTLNNIRSKQQRPPCNPGPEMVLAIEKCKVLSSKLQTMAKTLLLCNQDSHFVQMWTSSTPLEMLPAIVVHTAVTMSSRQGFQILWPFVTMLNDPASLMNAYLPTMPEDMLPQVRQALNSQGDLQGKFYKCSRGHRYFVGDCGRPMVQAVCPECNEPIGGLNHQPVANNSILQQLNVSNQCGYILPLPAQRSSDPIPERQLSPIACCLMRIMMHSVLLWACNMDASDGVRQLVKERDTFAAVQLLLQHLKKDFETLQKAMGKSELECTILVHAVLRNILFEDRLQNSALNKLSSSLERSEWEKTFCDSFITPVLRDMSETLPKELELIINDDKKEYGRLLYIVNEKLDIATADLGSHAWAYHPNLSLENLSVALESQSMQSQYPILHSFLQNEHVLRATQYIHDIYKLLSFLHSRYNNRVDHKDISSTNIASFLHQLPAQSSGDVKVLLDGLNKAWGLCKNLLKTKTRLEIKDEYLIPSFAPDVSLDYIIPTTVGAGACVTALLDFLVCKHNEFINDCKIKLQEENSKMKHNWHLQKVPIQHFQRFHTLDYESKISSVISSHCEYSLVTGKGQNVQYDFFGIQKQLINQFINGKPIIISHIPHVIYRKDVHSVQSFSKIKENLCPQVKLPFQSQQDILGELTSIPQLKEALDMLETVMAFLTDGSCRSVEMNLYMYAESLKIKLSTKIQEHCKLSHVLSLWEIVSVSMARQHVIRKEEPFEGLRFQKALTVLQSQKLKSVLRQFKLDQLVARLYIFISIYIRNAEKHEQETTSIVQGIDLFRDIYDDDDIPGFATHFPSDITLEQAVSVWKLIVEYQNTVEGFKLM